LRLATRSLSASKPHSTHLTLSAGSPHRFRVGMKAEKLIFFKFHTFSSTCRHEVEMHRTAPSPASCKAERGVEAGHSRDGIARFEACGDPAGGRRSRKPQPLGWVVHSSCSLSSFLFQHARTAGRFDSYSLGFNLYRYI